MSPVRDLLQRFRPAGTPGGAAAAGVPADRAKDLAAELEPVLSMLDGAEADCVRILSEADHDARRIRDDARRKADDTIAAARERAQAVRADAAAAVLAQAEADAGAAVRVTGRQARTIRERAAQQMPAYVGRAVRAVRMLAGDDAEAAGETQAGAISGRAS